MNFIHDTHSIIPGKVKTSSYRPIDNMTLPFYYDLSDINSRFNSSTFLAYALRWINQTINITRYNNLKQAEIPHQHTFYFRFVISVLFASLVRKTTL